MEALRFTATQLPLLGTKHSTLGRPLLFGSVNNGRRRHPVKPFVKATLSKSGAEVSAKPSSAVSPGENPLPATLPIVSPCSLQYPEGYLGAVPVRGPEESDAMGHLTSILTSKVYDVAIETQLQFATKLSERLGVNFWLKREDFQSVFSFKLRGAYNMMAKLPKEQLESGVICASAGNHAQGVALAAQILGCRAVVVMPTTTPKIKSDAVRRLGAEVDLVGDSFDEAQTHARMRAEKENLTFIPPFDNLDIIMGQGTVGMEIVRQMQEPLHAIFVPIGGGGLIAGIAAFVRRVNPEVKIIGVEPSDANGMALSLHHDQRVILDQVGSFADGVAVKEVGEETFRLCKELIDGVVLVSRDAMSAAIKDVFEENRTIIEPAGALALAGAEAYCKYYGLKGENVVAVTSGANMDFDKLRVIAELANVGSGQEAVLATTMPEKPGSFKQFCELVGTMNISEFKYRYGSDEKAVVLYSVGVHTDSELEAMQQRLESSQLKTCNLTSNDVVKDHLRYLIGGRLKIPNEVLCRFIFPERPGALRNFLDTFSPRWNISSFHYRGQGDIFANVLVGLQVASSEMDEFHSCAKSLGYKYDVVADDDDCMLLMH